MAVQPGGAAPPLWPQEQIPKGKVSGLAIASLVLGVLGLFTAGLTALLGLIFGIIALIKISRSRGALSGTGLAIAGTIVSAILALMLPLMAAMLLPALAQAKGKAQSINCMNNLRQLGLGGMMYANDNKDRFPSADNWCDTIQKYMGGPKPFLCPAGDPSRRCHYAFNSRLSAADSRQVSSPNQTVLLFETEGGWNLNGGPELLLKRHRHGGAVGIVFADGHSEMAREPRLRSLKWEP